MTVARASGRNLCLSCSRMVCGMWGLYALFWSVAYLGAEHVCVKNTRPRAHISWGILPLRWLRLNEIISMLARLPNSGGIGPLSRLVGIVKVTRLVS